MPGSRPDEVASPCAICGRRTELLFARHGYPIVGCTSCGHRQAALVGALIDPRDDTGHVEKVHASGGSPNLARAGDRAIDRHVHAVYGDAYFTDGGAGYTDYHAEARLLRRRGRRYGELLMRHRSPGLQPPGRLLDVGAAAGYVLQGCVDAGWRGSGVEPNATMAAHARDVLGLDVATAAFGHGREVAGAFDAITMIQVIAHFADPVRALRHARELLAPGGLLLVESWDRGSRTARVLGPRWHEYSPPSVLHWFTSDELDRIAAEAGLRREAHGRFTKWIGLQHAASVALGGGRADSPARRVLRLLPARAALPYPSEDLFWALYRCTR